MRYFFTPSRAKARATHVHVFDTVGEMVDQCQAPADKCQDRYIVSRLAQAAKGDGWTYGELRNAATYNATMREGWRDALPRIEALALRISAKVAEPLDVRRKMRRGPEGDELDIHAVNSGNLGKAWTARKRAVARAPAPIRIIANVVYNCETSSEVFFWRGAAALALVRALRRKGYRTAISGAGLLVSPFSNGRGTLDYLARFDALRYGEAIDTARLAAVLCSSAMLRHTIFRTILTTPAVVTSGFGYAPDDQKLARCVIESGAFPNSTEERLMIPDIANERDAGRWLERVSAQFA